MASDPGTGRVLGLDLGDARIGVAISDPDRRVAVPTGTIHVGRPPGELKAIAALVTEQGVTLVVVGHPRSLDGSRGPRAQQAEAFVDALRMAVTVPVELQDERLTTVQAERDLREAGVKGREQRNAVDAAAASLILQAWLDVRAGSRGAEG
ncbi:MAG: Holliday junction resolvase RuvX [Actinomycetota bacterium]